MDRQKVDRFVRAGSRAGSLFLKSKSDLSTMPHLERMIAESPITVPGMPFVTPSNSDKIFKPIPNAPNTSLPNELRRSKTFPMIDREGSQNNSQCENVENESSMGTPNNTVSNVFDFDLSIYMNPSGSLSSSVPTNSPIKTTEKPDVVKTQKSGKPKKLKAGDTKRRKQISSEVTPPVSAKRSSARLRSKHPDDSKYTKDIFDFDDSDGEDDDEPMKKSVRKRLKSSHQEEDLSRRRSRPPSSLLSPNAPSNEIRDAVIQKPTQKQKKRRHSAGKSTQDQHDQDYKARKMQFRGDTDADRVIPKKRLNMGGQTKKGRKPKMGNWAKWRTSRKKETWVGRKSYGWDPAVYGTYGEGETLIGNGEADVAQGELGGVIDATSANHQETMPIADVDVFDASEDPNSAVKSSSHTVSEKVNRKITSQVESTSKSTSGHLNDHGIPLCHHRSPAQLCVSKTKNMNVGKQYYRCSISAAAARCDFFVWALDYVKSLPGHDSAQDGDELLSRCFHCFEHGHTAENCPNTSTHPTTSLQPNKMLINVQVTGNPLASCSKDAKQADLLGGLKSLYGYSSFLPGQEIAIRRALSGQNSLLILPTGGGKSLAYQLASYLMEGFCLVVCPLVSLMQDQVARLPKGLNGACLGGNRSFIQQVATLEDVRHGRVKALFVSPEKLFSQWFLSQLPTLPKVSLCCIDEAHCASEWSHNFRPSYLRLGTLLKSQLQCGSVMALTATATRSVEEDMKKTLNIPDDGVLRCHLTRPNLYLSSSHDVDRSLALKLLLRSPKYRNLNGILIYVTLRREAEELAHMLLNEHFDVMAYHAGKENHERARIQKLFMEGKVKIIVATIAFGLGLDRTDVRAVIHYRMPRSVENYVQEIGRSGRDGKPAYCHTFLNPKDAFQLRVFSYADSSDFQEVEKMLKKIFPQKWKKPKRFENVLVLPVLPTSVEVDMRPEVISTLLTYLEGSGHISMLPDFFTSADVYFKKTAIQTLAKSNAIVATLAQSKNRQGKYSCNIQKIIQNTTLSPTEISRELEKLQRIGEISVEFREPAFCVDVLNNPEDMEELAESLVEMFQQLVKSKLSKINSVYSLLSRHATHGVECFEDEFSDVEGHQNEIIYDSGMESSDNLGSEQCNESPSTPQRVLQARANAAMWKGIEEYFDRRADDLSANDELKKESRQDLFLRSEIWAFLKRNDPRGIPLTPRAITRILYGITSPAYPIKVWGRDKCWGKYIDVEYETLRQEISSAVAKFRHEFKSH